MSLFVRRSRSNATRHAPGRQGVSGRMPEHVDVYWEGRIGGLSGTFNHSPDSHAAVQRVYRACASSLTLGGSRLRRAH
jgi:hypothetical protein